MPLESTTQLSVHLYYFEAILEMESISHMAKAVGYKKAQTYHTESDGESHSGESVVMLGLLSIFERSKQKRGVPKKNQGDRRNILTLQSLQEMRKRRCKCALGFGHRKIFSKIFPSSPQTIHKHFKSNKLKNVELLV